MSELKNVSFDIYMFLLIKLSIIILNYSLLSFLPPIVFWMFSWIWLAIFRCLNTKLDDVSLHSHRKKTNLCTHTGEEMMMILVWILHYSGLSNNKTKLFVSIIKTLAQYYYNNIHSDISYSLQLNHNGSSRKVLSLIYISSSPNLL